MWEDPIVKETRELRNQYAKQFNFDFDAIYEDICNRQKKLEKKCVSFSARKPKVEQKIAYPEITHGKFCRWLKRCQ